MNRFSHVLLKTMTRRTIIFLCLIVLIAIFVGYYVTVTIVKKSIKSPTNPFDTPPIEVEPEPTPSPGPTNGSGNNSKPQKHPTVELRELEQPQ